MVMKNKTFKDKIKFLITREFWVAVVAGYVFSIGIMSLISYFTGEIPDWFVVIFTWAFWIVLSHKVYYFLKSIMGGKNGRRTRRRTGNRSSK